jgi:hypothetical protein
MTQTAAIRHSGMSAKGAIAPPATAQLRSCGSRGNSSDRDAVGLVRLLEGFRTLRCMQERGASAPAATRCDSLLILMSGRSGAQGQARRQGPARLLPFGAVLQNLMHGGLLCLCSACQGCRGLMCCNWCGVQYRGGV